MFLEANIINNSISVTQAIEDVFEIKIPTTEEVFEVEAQTIEDIFEAKTIESEIVIVRIDDAWVAWSNYYQLYTSTSEEVVDKDGKYVFAKKSDTDMGDSYKSAYTGSEIDKFVSEVLK